ncbi:hypothetical protein PLESTB_001092300 [Pleodorina starrii]|uniref:Uncharacterized protein n=1 Tax=Pleodorina starrii TaxID=330485 RepID=A0A9W6BQ32_9CHLO|nr:hypothetical protein PLESTM_000694300 [Pleodorina starrii]GLC56321.1 hypothetical protein PLESTB_001092300 [Pleodorina starrii]GLC77164.1 hypothetical protein PLESTF_001893300 [Pleodorina starrii]
MEPLLDNLTLAPAAQLFELDPPHYTSSYGRKTEAIFKYNVPPAPMLISPDNGLILYERVISTRAEHQLLDKLTKPKYYHPTAIVKKGGKGGAHAAVSSSSPAAQPQSTSRRPSSSSSHPPTQPAGRTPSATGGSERSSSSGAAAATATASDGRRAGGPDLGQQHRTRTFSAGRPAAGGGNHIKRKPLYPEDGPLKDYFSKERASVTATTVFTWGNRYKIGDCGGVGRMGLGGGGGGRSSWNSSGSSENDRASFSSYTPVQQKPPLRL